MFALGNMRIKCFGHYNTPNGKGRPIVNVFDFNTNLNAELPAGVGNEQLAITGFLNDIWTPAVVPALTSSYLPDKITCKFTDHPGNFEVTGATPQGTGTIVTDPLSGDSAVFQRLITNSSLRKYTGSKHWAMAAESDTTESELSVGGLAHWVAVATALLAGFTAFGNSNKLVVVSQSSSDFTADPAIIDFQFVKQILTCSTIGTMRKRKEKGVYV